MFTAFFHNPLVLAAVAGALAAARVDYVAFQAFKSPTEAAAYDWKIAAWRWFQGAVTGIAVAKGFGAA